MPKPHSQHSPYVNLINSIPKNKTCERALGSPEGRFIGQGQSGQPLPVHAACRGPLIP